ncbi:MAG: putative addiction module antidote protein [Cycloclasticus sp.]|nr:MAG: putative addiction module antidote protein [Cycloclasticus sp.]
MKTKSYNPFNHLLTRNEITEYLTAAIEDDDPSVFITALGHVITHKGVTATAKDTGLNRESLYKFISGKTKPQWDTVSRLTHSMGVKLTASM